MEGEFRIRSCHHRLLRQQAEDRWDIGLCGRCAVRLQYLSGYGQALYCVGDLFPVILIVYKNVDKQQKTSLMAFDAAVSQ